MNELDFTWKDIQEMKRNPVSGDTPEKLQESWESWHEHKLAGIEYFTEIPETELEFIATVFG